MQHKQFSVALSFAGEDRVVAEELAVTLRNYGVRVFYDLFEKSKLWGKDLYEYLTDIYRDQSDFCIVLLSKNYRNSWTKVELRAALARAFDSDIDYLLPVILDDIDIRSVPGLNPTQGYLSTDINSVQDIALSIIDKLKAKGVPRIPFPGIYENFLLRIVLHCTSGQHATIEKYSSMRITTESASEILDDVTLSGEIGEISVSPGFIVERRQEGITTVIRSKLDRSYVRGEVLARTVKTVVNGVFIDLENFWGHRVTNPTSELSIEIQFPKGCKPSSWKQVSKFGNSLLQNPKPVWDRDANCLRWMIGEAKVGEHHKLWWSQ